MDLRPGSKIKTTSNHELEIVSVLGSGGFGIVFKAHDENGTPFAVKTISTASLDNAQVAALRNEAELAVEIQHPNVLAVHFFHDGQTYHDLPPYVVADYADGGTLERLLESRTTLFSAKELSAFFGQLIDGMEAINSKLVHRDVKPENVLIDSGKLKIADFGLSKIVGAATRSTDATFKGFGTLAYCAPEAFTLEANTPAMDMYSMGIIFYGLATLHHPYSVSYSLPPAVAWREAHIGQKVLDPRSHNSDLSLPMAQTIMKMIAKRPADRFQSWADVRQALAATTPAAKAHVPDVEALVERVMVRHLEKEAAIAATESKNSETEQALTRVGYSFSELERDVREAVDAFNAQCQFGKITIRTQTPDLISPSSIFVIFITTDAGPVKGWDAEQITLEVMLNDGRWKLPYDSRVIFAAGSFASSKNRRGVNLLLLADGPDDLYGKWYTLRSRPNPLVTSDASIPAPHAFNADELDEQMRYVGVSFHKYYMRLEPWDKDIVVEIVGFLL
jgi:serine/threonine protein kinase